MSAEGVLDKMAAVHFQEWIYHVRAVRDDLVRDLRYDSLPDSERKMRRELMRQVLSVVATAIDDEVLLDAANAGDIAIDQAGELSERLTDWLET